VIRKPDGTVVTVLASAHTVVEKPNGDRVTHLADGVRIFEKAGGDTAQAPAARAPAECSVDQR
jgi:hypothetical protein